MTPENTTLTYLFSDLESSTQLWERYPDAMQGALERHDAILQSAVEAADGTVVKTTGDGLMAVFPTVSDAVDSSLHAQRGLRDERWGETGPLRVRMGIHIGEAQTRAGDYFGPTVNRAARIMSAAHGGQILLSGAAATAVTRSLAAEVSLRDMGRHRLKDLAGPENLFQLVQHGLPETFPPLETLDARPNNLPTQTSAFLGRESELATIRELLDSEGVRLLTMTGPGGTGKTRLALQAAADQIDRFDDGLFFVDLTAERDAEAAYTTIALVLGLESAGDDSPLDTLQERLRDRTMLLVLDNFEQVTDAASGVAGLLASCPRLNVLVTSREALHVRGERNFAVPPLSLPPSRPGTPASVDEITKSEAVQLLVERAEAVQPDFVLSEDNAASVAAICVQLDGLPLAIELAAARLRIFSPEDLRARLEHRLDVLRGGARDLPERQRTLRTTIEWSYDLLDESDQQLLQLFAVFSGGRFDAVEDVVGRVDPPADIDVIDGLQSLVDKSLVRRVETSDRSTRFSMLQTIRDYAAEKLEARQEILTATQQGHADHYAEFAAALRPHLADSRRDAALDDLSTELGNLQTAWQFRVDDGDLERLNELLDTLWVLYDARGWYHGAIDMAKDLLGVLAMAPETPERIREEVAVQMSLARALMTVRGYTDEVEAAFTEALRRSADAGDVPQRFPVLRSLASLYVLRAEFAKGVEVGRELLTLADQQEDPALEVDAQMVLGAHLAFSSDMNLGLEHLDRAIELFEPKRTRAERFLVGPNPGIVAMTTSGFLLWMLGFPKRAVERMELANRTSHEIGHPSTLAYALFHVAFLDLWRQELGLVAERAVELLQVANANDYQIWRALAIVLEGTTRIGFGDGEAGLMEVERGMSLYQGLTTPPAFGSSVLTLRAAALGGAGHVDDALVLVDEVMEHTSQGSGLPHADTLLLRGDLLLGLDEPAVAEAHEHFELALEMATDAGLRTAGLKAATRIARTRIGTPEEGEATRDLREIYSTFTEDFDTVDLAAARAVLERE